MTDKNNAPKFKGNADFSTARIASSSNFARLARLTRMMHQIRPISPNSDTAAPDQITISIADDVSFSMAASLEQSRKWGKATLQVRFGAGSHRSKS